jgi:RimJ/RimL family protein N-acetyltransferase
MNRAEILTANLKLLLKTREEALASIEAMSPSDRAEVSPEWLARVKASGSVDPWMHGFALVHRASGNVIGSCGFKAPPGQDATVEIAYGVDPTYQGRGYATEAARALITFAFDSGLVNVVRAHTRPNHNASTRVLTKCGFKCIGEVMDPEDGLVWRWELKSSTSENATQ